VLPRLPSHDRQRKVVLAWVLARLAGLEEVRSQYRHVVGGDDEIGHRPRQALVGEKALERPVGSAGVVILVEQALRAAYPLDTPQSKIFGPLVLVERDELLGRHRIGRAQRAGKNAAGGGAGDQSNSSKVRRPARRSSSVSTRAGMRPRMPPPSIASPRPCRRYRGRGTRARHGREVDSTSHVMSN
jgi:hypothetical protein